MTRIDFYIIEQGSEEAIKTFICRLTEKAWSQNNSVYIHTMDEQHSTSFDDLLWTFSETCFIPHQIAKPHNSEKIVLIGHETITELPHHHDVLINLQHQAPSFFSQFERVAEIISNDETSKVKGRERYQFYRDRGYALETHKMSL